MSLTHVDLTRFFSLDILPSKCVIEGQAKIEDGELRLQFRAQRPVGRWRRRMECSEWSGWFPYENEPIALCWKAFWL